MNRIAEVRLAYSINPRSFLTACRSFFRSRWRRGCRRVYSDCAPL